MNALEIKNITKSFGDNIVLQDFSVTIKDNEFICFVGESGCGKSTLLNIIGVLEKADRGTIRYFDIENVKPYSRKAEQLLRNEVGYLFQNFALVDDMSVYENLKVALQYTKTKDKKTLIKQALEDVGLKGFEDKKVFKCSGGEQQRIAIARLMLKPCRIVLADEPTGSLDPHNKQMVISLLLRLKAMGKTILVVTHDSEVAAIADRIIALENNKNTF